MGERFAFNINAELYENKFGELAIKFTGEKVYAEVGTEQGESFLDDCIKMLQKKMHPDHWRDIPAHQLLYGQDWHCISRMGFINGDESRPAIELDVKPDEMGQEARSYLGEVFH